MKVDIRPHPIMEITLKIHLFHIYHSFSNVKFNLPNRYSDFSTLIPYENNRQTILCEIEMRRALPHFQ